MFSRKDILNKIGQITLHIIFWCAVLLFFTYFFGVGSKNYKDTLTFALFLMPITIATTYISIYKLIPEYLISKQYFRFCLYSLYTIIISGYLIMVSVFFSLIYLSNFSYADMNPLTRNIILITTAVYIVVVLVSAFKLLKLHLKHAEKTKILETRILDGQLQLKEQELHYLKMQIHPHFLFNTLNTMYGFALKKADETPEMILKLSNLLDYLLYQVDKPFVLLVDEINHIKDYIDLEKMRFNNTLDISFTSEDINETTQVAPMLLLPFIENSFKHGSIKNGVLKIKIDVSSTKENILFSIVNTSSFSETSNEGIGLQNIKKRLDLLYKNKYDLKIDASENLFKVDLKLNNN
ncbi:histidine kinase [Oceanihabitans sp. 2_MG-2023]|uniref:sensor histidine kinase n=1 Tax=Oceanihabitans sp. 2_MG-2023 TaxID=3062661 RepID=UPI0026E1D73F|nr:histidine kinase [Oceanihabitans sp. 2_MG-2023]MDO6597294.1 histidine kinase [Oceanihabitans sp. 2_MG-2023]